jgi:hypothetical protein
MEGKGMSYSLNCKEFFPKKEKACLAAGRTGFSDLFSII